MFDPQKVISFCVLQLQLDASDVLFLFRFGQPHKNDVN